MNKETIIGVLSALALPLFALKAEPLDKRETKRETGTWLAIVPPGHEKAIAPLAEHRKSEGWDVRIRKREELKAAGGGALEVQIRNYLHSLVEDEATEKPVVAVLAGIPMAGEERQGGTVIPAIKGTFLRAKDVASDSGYSLKDGKPLKNLAVGRLPARDAGELEAMIGKIRKYESESGAARWKTRLSVIAAASGGGPMADAFVGQQLQNRLKRLPGRWTMEQVADLKGSLFNVPRGKLRTETKAMLERGQLFSCYLGHAGPRTVESNGEPFFTRDDFGALKIATGTGVFLTCGCESLDIDIPGKDGHGFSAMRSPTGPAAVIGAEGISYAALGLLAIDGLVKVLDEPNLDGLTLADCWKSVLAGIDSGEIHQTIFMLMDRGDGTGGQVPLADQRKEHLEMWMLLGDPAMRIPLIPGGVELECGDNEAAPASKLKISGKLPVGWNSATIRLTAERHLSSKPVTSTSPPDATPHQIANSFVLCETAATAEGEAFQATLPLPDALPEERIIIRALAENDGHSVQGAIEVPVKKSEEQEVEAEEESLSFDLE